LNERSPTERISNGIRLDLDWRTTLVTALLIPLLFGLGMWQLVRADEKAVIAVQWGQRQHQQPVALSAIATLEPGELEYLPVKLSGKFLANKYFLLDNRVYKGQFGYEVLGIFLFDDSEQVALVNRGWVAGDASRRELPNVASVEGSTALSGHIYVSPGKPFLLADMALASGWPKRIQAVEMEKIRPAVEQLVDVPLFPYPVRINPGTTAALTVDWQVVNVSPEKHTGYAVQWFAMAGALLLLFIFRSSNLWQVLTRGSSRTK